MVGHLSIFNSNKLLIFIVLFFISFLIIGEILLYFGHIHLYYGKDIDELIARVRISKKPACIVLGDSRAESGIVPEILEKEIDNYSYFNFASPGGSIIDEYNDLIKKNDLKPKLLIFTISPLDTFESDIKNKTNDNIRNKIKTKIAKYLKSIRYILHLSQSVEKRFSIFIQRRFRSYHGLNGLVDLAFFGEISQYYSPTGWSGIVRLGSDEIFAREVNRFYYHYKIFESKNNFNQIEMNKIELETIIKDSLLKNIQLIFIRLPISPSILYIENEKYPWFNQYFEKIAKKHRLKYYDANIDFKYSECKTDGSHLSRPDAFRFSKKMANSLRNYLICNQIQSN